MLIWATHPSLPFNAMYVGQDTAFGKFTFSSFFAGHRILFLCKLWLMKAKEITHNYTFYKRAINYTFIYTIIQNYTF